MGFFDSVFGKIVGFAVGGALGFLTGGAGFILIGAALGSLAVSTASAFLGQTPRRPTFGNVVDQRPFANSAAQALANAEDAEYPRTAIWGRRLVGYSKLWVGTDDSKYTNDNAIAMISGAICDHPVEEFLALQLAQDQLSIQTGILQTNDGQYKGGAFGLPDYWLVPKNTSRYVRQFQGEEDGPETWHFAIRLFDGTQTGDDAEFRNRNNAYAAKNRINRGVSYFNAMWVANTTLSFQGRPSEVVFKLDGKNDVHDPRGGGSTGFTSNAGLVLADYLKWRLNFTDADFAGLDDTADDCDGTIPGTSLPKYQIDAVVRHDEDPLQVMASMLEHMAGVMYEQAGKWVIKAGVPRAPVAALTVDDIAEGKPPVFQRRLEPDKRVNTLVPHSIAAETEGGKDIYQPHPLAPITKSEWVANDGGFVLESDLRLAYCTNDKRAKYLGWVIAQENRLEASFAVVMKLNSRTLKPRLFDVVTYTDPEMGIDAAEYRVDYRRWDFAANTIEFVLRQYDDDIYTPGALDEEPIGDLAEAYDGELQAPALIMAAVVPGGAAITGTGSGSIVQVRVSWEAGADVWIRAGGGYNLRWRLASGGAWAGTSTDGHTASKVLSLVADESYEIQVRSFTQFGTKSEWGSLLYSVPAQAGIPGPPIDAGFGDNLVPDWNFERGDAFVSASWQLIEPSGLTDWVMHDGTWDDAGVWHDQAVWFDDGTPAGSFTGSAVLVSGGGAISNNKIRITAAGTAPEPVSGAYDFRVRPRIRANVVEGQLFSVSALADHVSGTLGPQTELQLEVLWYDQDDVFVSATTVERWDPAMLGERHWLAGYAQAPNGLGVTRARPQVLAKWNEVLEVDTVWDLHGLIMRATATAGVNGPDATSTITSTSLVPVQDYGLLLYAPPEGNAFRVRATALVQQDATDPGHAEATSEVYAELSRYPDGVPGSRVVLRSEVVVSEVEDGAVTPWRHVELVAQDVPPVAGGTQYVYELRGRVEDATAPADWDDRTMDVRIA